MDCIGNLVGGGGDDMITLQIGGRYDFMYI